MKHKYRTWIFYAVLVLGLVGGAFIFGIMRDGTGSVHAKDVLAPEVPGASPFNCTISNVAVYINRMHVKCVPGDGVILYFAYATDSANSSTANRLLAIANSAYAVGDRLTVWYYPSSSDNPPGCQVNDCRKLAGLAWIP
ncbi:MAG: hypothetical protein WA997_17305 [Anaerolineales bacterium]|nr:hypothetical protein [Anaerolineales bacterium]